MAIADHISPREAVRFALKDRFRDLIEGAVHDPGRGRPTFEQGGFSVIDPVTCVGFIQTKPSVSNIAKFQNRLREIANTLKLLAHLRQVWRFLA